MIQNIYMKQRGISWRLFRGWVRTIGAAEDRSLIKTGLFDTSSVEVPTRAMTRSWESSSSNHGNQLPSIHLEALQKPLDNNHACGCERGRCFLINSIPIQYSAPQKYHEIHERSKPRVDMLPRKCRQCVPFAALCTSRQVYRLVEEDTRRVRNAHASLQDVNTPSSSGRYKVRGFELCLHGTHHVRYQTCAFYDANRLAHVTFASPVSPFSQNFPNPTGKPTKTAHGDARCTQNSSCL